MKLNAFALSFAEKYQIINLNIYTEQEKSLICTVSEFLLIKFEQVKDLVKQNENA